MMQWNLFRAAFGMWMSVYLLMSCYILAIDDYHGINDVFVSCVCVATGVMCLYVAIVEISEMRVE
jgi:hypothetical protein